MGGQAATTNVIENYPGFPDGVGGSALGESFQKQAERFGARVEFDRAVAVDLSQRPFRVTTDNTVYLAESLIIATGASPNKLHIPGETELTGRGVSWCATCDGWFFREKDNSNNETVQVFFMTLYAPSVMAATEEAQSKEADSIKQRTTNNVDTNAQFLKSRQRWEAEGLHTMFKGEGDSQFQ